MLAVLRQLITPLDYLAVRSDGGSKVALDIIMPVILTVLCTVLMTVSPSMIPLLGDHGFVANLNGLLQTLTGFFVGALAAVATFPNPLMDQKTDNLYLRGDRIVRRLFLAKIFAFLAAEAFFIYLVGLFVSVPAHLYTSLSGTNVQPFFRCAALAIYLFAFWQMLCVTLLGLYYLCERIHRHPEIR